MLGASLCRFWIKSRTTVPFWWVPAFLREYKVRRGVNNNKARNQIAVQRLLLCSNDCRVLFPVLSRLLKCVCDLQNREVGALPADNLDSARCAVAMKSRRD